MLSYSFLKFFENMSIRITPYDVDVCRNKMLKNMEDVGKDHYKWGLYQEMKTLIPLLGLKN